MLQEKSSPAQKEPGKLAKLQKVEVMYLKCVPFNPSNLKSFQGAKDIATLSLKET